MMRPMVFVDQDDKETHNRDHEFLCGEHILVCPIVKPNASSRLVYLPKGEWYNFWTGDMFKGGQEYDVNAPLDKIPIFIKAGAIIPFYPVQQYVGEKTITEITLKIHYTTGQEQSDLYEDDRESFDYENDAFRLSVFTLNGESKQVSITQSFTGSYQPEIKAYILELIGFPFKVNQLIVDGETQAVADVIRVKADFGKLALQ